MRLKTVLATTALATVVLGKPSGTFGQNVSIGIVGGAGLTDDFRREVLPAFQGFPGEINYSTPKRYIGGAMVELGFASHFSLEVCTGRWATPSRGSNPMAHSTASHPQPSSRGSFRCSRSIGSRFVVSGRSWRPGRRFAPREISIAQIRPLRNHRGFRRRNART